MVDLVERRDQRVKARVMGSVEQKGRWNRIPKNEGMCRPEAGR